MKKVYESFDIFYIDPEKPTGERCEFFKYRPPSLPPKEELELTPEKRLSYLKFYGETLAEKLPAHEVGAVEVVSEKELRETLTTLKEKPIPSVRQVTPIQYLSWRLLPENAVAEDIFTIPPYTCFHESTIPLIERKNRPLHVRATWEQGAVQDIMLLDLACVVDGYTLFVNGKKVCAHDGYEPHRVDITAYIRENAENVLDFYIPTKENYPIGIGDRLTLLGLSENYIEHTFVSTEKIGEDATIRIRTTLSGMGKLTASVAPWYPDEGEEVLSDVSIAADGTLSVPCPNLWTPDTPNLYVLTLRLWDGDTCVDEVKETFGIRIIEEHDGKIWLNGKPFFMKSFGNSLACDNDLESYGNLFPPDRYILRDMLLIKKSGANFMRIHHWGAEGVPGSYYECGWPEYGKCIGGTNYERFAEIADQLGLCLLWITRHWCNWPSGFVYGFEPDKMEERLTASIKKVQNHPSIAVYEGLNEVGFMLGNNYLFPTDPKGEGVDPKEKMRQKERYQVFLNRFTDLVNEIDGTRLILPDSPWGPFYTPSQEVEAVVKTTDLVQAEDRSLYDRKNTVWDVHTYSGWYSGLQSAFYYRDMSWGRPHEKPVLLTELGAEAMPKWDLYAGTPWYGVWVNHHHYTGSFEQNIYGRPLRILKDSEMDISQAYQGLCIHYNALVARLTSCDGLNINLIGDGPGEGTYHKGVTDLYRKAKLGYFAAQMSYQPLLLTGANHSFALSPQDELSLSLSKEAIGEAGAYRLSIRMENRKGETIWEKEQNITVTEDAVQHFGTLPVGVSEQGLYRVRYILTKEN